MTLGAHPPTRHGSERVFVGTLTVNVLLGDVRSLKQKRSVVRPILADLRRKFAVAVAETGHQDLYRRVELGLATVADNAAHCQEVLDSCERLVAGRPEIELLSAHQRLIGDED